MTLPIHIVDLELSRGNRVLFSGLSLNIKDGDRIAITGTSGVWEIKSANGNRWFA